MKYCIIGLGIYGSNLAKDLTSMGHEVVGADIRASNVENIKNLISTAYIIDSTDEASLAALPLRNVDVVIVAIGENFGASIKTVALLKKIGAKHIYARAIDTLHQAILEGMDVERILTPEQRAAWDLVHEMELGGEVQSLGVAGDVHVLQFDAPSYFYGARYSDLTKLGDGITLIAVTTLVPVENLIRVKSEQRVLVPSTEWPNTQVKRGDKFTCIGSLKAFRHLFRHIN